MNKKIITTTITDMEFPNIGIGYCDCHTVKVKGALLGQTVTAKIKKRRDNELSAILLEVLDTPDEQAAGGCNHKNECGGCTFQSMSYDTQLTIKENMILNLFKKECIDMGQYTGIYSSPQIYHYRNKMEYTFGDTGKDGCLSLGMRKKNSFYEAVHVTDCLIADDDFCIILKYTLDFFINTGLTFYNSRKHTGDLRHLVVRKSQTQGDILINLVTSHDIQQETLKMYKAALLALTLRGSVTGIINSINNSLADAVKLNDMHLIYGKDYFYEEVLGLVFKITPESFFQTNTQGAELLYKKVLSLIGKCKTVYDLYCGTGTITQIISQNANKAIGVELIPSAIEAAIENAKINNISNVEFICGDVLTVIDELADIPDLIVLDPPRNGVHPKALKKIVNINAEKIIYISCKATSLVRDLHVFIDSGYKIDESFIVDMFAFCAHVECVVLLSREC